MRFKLNILLFLCVIIAIGRADDFWERIDNFYGAGTFSVAVSAGGIIYAGVQGGGLFRSSDVGAIWNRIEIDFGQPYDKTITSVTVSSNSAIYIGTEGIGIFVSKDNGNTWIKTIVGLNSLSIRILVHDEDGNIFAGTSDGVYKINDTSDTWIRCKLGMQGDITALDIALDNTIYASGFFLVGGLKIYNSTDGGTNWTSSASGLPENNLVSCLEAAEQRIFAGTINNGIYYSSDNGTTWTNSALHTLTGQITAINVISDNIVVAATRTNGLFRSTDQGNSWQKIQPNHDYYITSFARINDKLIAGAWGPGVMQSDDSSASWRITNYGLNSAIINDIEFSENNIFIGTDGAGIIQSDDFGDNWRNSNVNLKPLFVSSLLASGNLLYSAFSEGGLYISSDFGNNWDIEHEIFDSLMIFDMTKTLSDDIYIGTNNRGIFFKKNQSNEWMQSVEGLPDSTVTCISIMGDKYNGIYSSINFYGIYKKDNSESDWIYSSEGFIATNAISFACDSNRVLAGSRSLGLFVSYDRGTSWTMLFDNDQIPIDVTALCIANDGSIFAGTFRQGIFYNKKGGKWQKLDFPGEDWASVNCIKSDSNGFIWAGLDGGGLLRSIKPVYIQTDEYQKSIIEIHPNPVSDVLVVSIFSEYNITTNLIIRDLFGISISEVPVSFNQVMNTSRIDINRLTSGIYFLEINLKGQKVNKLFIVKK